MTIYDGLINILPPRIFIPRYKFLINNKIKNLQPLHYDLMIFAYRREIGYYQIKCTCAGNIIIKNKLISFYDDELISSVNKIYNYLIQENIIDRMSDEAIKTVPDGSS